MVERSPPPVGALNLVTREGNIGSRPRQYKRVMGPNGSLAFAGNCVHDDAEVSGILSARDGMCVLATCVSILAPDLAVVAWFHN
jgi:hypothetical protein